VVAVVPLAVAAAEVVGEAEVVTAAADDVVTGAAETVVAAELVAADDVVTGRRGGEGRCAA